MNKDIRIKQLQKRLIQLNKNVEKELEGIFNELEKIKVVEEKADE